MPVAAVRQVATKASCTAGRHTFMVQDIQPGPDGSGPAEMTAAGGLMFLAASDDLHGRELWAAVIDFVSP
jgi:hypothetical protein